ncbi:MAG TPA: ABC transporter ATP-binding protein [Micromonosporaceae bacterium]
MRGDVLLEVHGLHAGYGGADVLRGVDLSVPAAAVVAVLGANGAGKTTLLRTLCGLLRPSGGTITFDGKDLATVPVEHRVRRGIALVPDGRGVVEELTVAENLRLGGLWRRDPAGVRTAAAVAEVYELFEPLARRRGLAAHHLSGGERRMLAIGRALVARPRLLLLDEPSLGLAPPLVAAILTLLPRLRETAGLAVLLVEQNVRAALAIADTAVIVTDGRIATAGTGAVS